MSNAFDILARCKFPGFNLFVQEVGGQNFIRVECDGTDNITGQHRSWKGRHWRISAHMTDGEIVQTAFLAVMTSIEHEARERFTFDGVSVFDPHYDIHALAEFRRSAGVIKGRAP